MIDTTTSLNKHIIKNLERIARRKAALRLAIQAQDAAAIEALLAELAALTTGRITL